MFSYLSIYRLIATCRQTLRRDSRTAWVKNDHLGFEVHYVFQGAVRKYRPDFLVRMVGGSLLILEVKGQDTAQDQTKREFLGEWVEAVNEQGGFGRLAWDVSRIPSDVEDILAKHAANDPRSGAQP